MALSLKQRAGPAIGVRVGLRPKDLVPPKVVYLASTNIHKYLEAREVMASHGLSLAFLREEVPELQGDDVAEIAAWGARWAADKWDLPILVEDTGLFIEALNGFPGPYASYVLKTIGLEGILKLLEGVEDRRAYFKTALAFCDGKGVEPVVFTGEAHGTISHEPRGSGGFGYDPIFVPEGGDGRTFAEMSKSEKNTLSHRAKAFKAFAEWFARERGLRAR